MMDILELLRDYGWVGVVVLYFAPKVWQFVTERFFPQIVSAKKREDDRRDAAVRAERESRDAALQAEREARSLLLKSQIEREDREFEHRKEIDNRIAAAVEGTLTAIQQLALAITVGNERITQLISAHSRHDNFVISAHEQVMGMLDTRQEVEDLKRKLEDTQNNIRAISKKKGQPE